MTGRQHTMALILAALLLVVGIATAAKPQPPPSQVQISIKFAPEAWRVPHSNVTSRAKIPSPSAVTLPSSDLTTTANQGAIWGHGFAYDLKRTSQSSIYVLYTPAMGK